MGETFKKGLFSFNDWYIRVPVSNSCRFDVETSISLPHFSATQWLLHNKANKLNCFIKVQYVLHNSKAQLVHQDSTRRVYAVWILCRRKKSYINCFGVERHLFFHFALEQLPLQYMDCVVSVVFGIICMVIG